MQSCGAAQANGEKILVESVPIGPSSAAPTDTVRNEFRSRLLQDLPDRLKGSRFNALVSIRPLEPADGDDRDAGLLSQVRLFKTQERAGGADLLGGDIHER